MAGKKPERDTYLQFVLEQLAPVGGEITARAMMGGQTLYCDGIVFALIGHGALHLKADAENRPMFEARGLPAFQPDPKERPEAVLQYYLVPADVLEDREELARWAREAVHAGRRASAVKTRRGGGRRA